MEIPEITPAIIAAFGEDAAAILKSGVGDKHAAFSAVTNVRQKMKLALEWPEEWKNCFFVEVFGSFRLRNVIKFPSLRIAIDGRHELGPSNFGAQWFYSTRVEVDARTPEGFFDGISRLEQALGALYLASMTFKTARGPGCAIHYRCRLVDDVGDGGQADITSSEGLSNTIITQVTSCSDRRVRELLWRAVWWMRHAKGERLSGHHNPSLFLIYLSYWNAFECSVQAINLKHPLKKLTTLEKNERIKEILTPFGANVTAEAIQLCREALDQGIRNRIKHALEYTQKYVPPFHADEAFKAIYNAEPVAERLYRIRNDIDHGNIVEYDLRNNERVQRGLSRLGDITYAVFNASVVGPDSNVGSP